MSAQLMDQLERAHKMVCALSRGEARWTMSIPARPDDPDLLIGKALRDAMVALRFAPPGLEQVMAEANTWAAETFPLATTTSCAAHLLREATELALNPTDPDEMADVVLLVGHLAAAAGVDLAAAAARKLAVNRTRKWGQPDAQGVVEHLDD